MALLKERMIVVIKKEKCNQFTTLPLKCNGAIFVSYILSRIFNVVAWEKKRKRCTIEPLKKSLTTQRAFTFKSRTLFTVTNE